MINRVRKILFIFVLLLSLTFVACGNTKEPQLQIGVDASFLEVEVGKKLTIRYDCEKVCDASVDNDVVKIETISEKEVVLEGLKVGKATLNIFVKDDSQIKVSIEINVKEEEFSFEATIENIVCGETKEIKITYNHGFEPNFEITTQSDIIKIDDFKVTGLKTGEATITINETKTNMSKKLKVTVLPVLVSDIVLNVKELKLKVDDIAEIKAEVLPTNASEKALIFESSDEKIVTVKDGKVIAVAAGTCEIYVFPKDGADVKKTIKIEVSEKAGLDELLEWAYNEVGVKGYSEVSLPTTHPEVDCKYEWSSSDEDLFCTDDGVLDFVEFNTDVELTCKAIYGGQTQYKTWTFTVTGSAFADLAQKFTAQFRAKKIYKSMDLVCDYPDYYGGSKIEWSSSDESIFSNTGEFNKPIDDSIVTISYKVVLGNPKLSENFSIDLKVEGKTINDLSDDINKWIDENVCTDGYIGEATILPTFIDEYHTTLEWLDGNNEKLHLEDYVGNPIFAGRLNVKVRLTYKGKTAYLSKHYNIKLKGYEDMWDKIKIFVDTINSTKITTYTYSLISWMGTENGYLPFYDTNNANVNVDILPYTFGNQRTNILKKSTEYVVVHDTGNPSKTANAEMHNRYIKNLNEKEDATSISWHYTVGDDGIYQHLPLDEVAYHAGDGSHVFGDTYYNTSFGAWSIGGGNRNGIGIESCVNEGVDYTVVMRKLAKLVAELLIQYNLDIDRVKQHNDFSGKNCPQVMRENNRWEEFLLLVRLEYFAKNNLKGVDFEWISKSENMDNTGRITKPNLKNQKVSYDVKVTYNGETKVYSFENVIKGR